MQIIIDRSIHREWVWIARRSYRQEQSDSEQTLSIGDLSLCLHALVSQFDPSYFPNHSSIRNGNPRLVPIEKKTTDSQSFTRCDRPDKWTWDKIGRMGSTTHYVSFLSNIERHHVRRDSYLFMTSINRIVSLWNCSFFLEITENWPTGTMSSNNKPSDPKLQALFP